MNEPVKRRNDNRITVLQDVNRRWYAQDVNQFVHMWQEGFRIDDIARALNKSVDEVFLLAFDRAREGFIEWRNNGVWGNRRPSA